MPYRSTPIPQTWPAAAANKRRAAERYEQLAAQRRTEAAELDKKWAAYVAARDAVAEKASA